jgi:hypothetical protein
MDTEWTRIRREMKNDIQIRFWALLRRLFSHDDGRNIGFRRLQFRSALSR